MLSSGNRFFKTNTGGIFGAATRRLLSPAPIPLSLGPIFHSYRSFDLENSRSLHSQALSHPAEEKEIVVIGGGMGALLGGIRPYYQEYKKLHGIAPKIHFITDESSHWLHKVHSDFDERPWGQPKKGLLQMYQALLTRMFPDLTSEKYPNFSQIRAIRTACMKLTQKELSINLIDDHVTQIHYSKNSKSLSFQLKSGKALGGFDPAKTLIYNISSVPRPSSVASLDMCREGGLLYSEGKTQKPVLFYGSGLSALWAVNDWSGPIVVIHKREFPLALSQPPANNTFYELYEDQASIRFLRNGDLMVEGEDIRSGQTVNMRLSPSNCFLSTGSVFNYNLTKHLKSSDVFELDVFSRQGKIAGEIAMGSLNPAGGLTHKTAVISTMLNRYPIQDFKNIAIYTNLWREYVSLALAKKGITLDEAFYQNAEPEMKLLFQENDIPTLNKLEDILKKLYEKLPQDKITADWSAVKDVLVPATDDFEHTIHPDIPMMSGPSPGLR